MAGIPGQIIGSFEDIGKDIAREAIKAPADIAGKALESLGSSHTPQQSKTSTQAAEGATKPKDAWDTFDAAAANAKAFARRALEALRARPKKEPSVWERIQTEAEQKKQLLQQQQQQQAAATVPMPTSKRPRGDLYGTKAKQLGSEVGKNVRQD